MTRDEFAADFRKHWFEGEDTETFEGESVEEMIDWLYSRLPESLGGNGNTRFKHAQKPSCRRCIELENRVDVLATENESLKELVSQSQKDSKAYGEEWEKFHKRLMKAAEEAHKRVETALQQQLEACQDEQHSKIQQIREAADQRMTEANRKWNEASEIKARTESEIWTSIAERLGLQLRAGYVIREEEVILAFELERERASHIKTALEQFTAKYEMLKRQVALIAPEIKQIETG